MSYYGRSQEQSIKNKGSPSTLAHFISMAQRWSSRELYPKCLVLTKDPSKADIASSVANSITVLSKKPASLWHTKRVKTGSNDRDMMMEWAHDGEIGCYFPPQAARCFECCFCWLPSTWLHQMPALTQSLLNVGQLPLYSIPPWPSMLQWHHCTSTH